MARRKRNRLEQAIEAGRKTRRLPGRGLSSQFKAGVRKFRKPKR